LKGDQRLWILHITDKTSNDKLKSRQHILGVIQHYSCRKIGTTQLENAEKLKLKIPQAQQLCRAERSLRIGNITTLIECTGRLFTAPTRHKQRWCGDKIEKIRTPKESQSYCIDIIMCRKVNLEDYAPLFIENAFSLHI
jgi:hypothetical protein